VIFPPKSESWGSRKTTMMERWQQLVQFLQEVRTELKKVHWPTRKEVVGSTVVVIVSVVIVSFFLGGIDVILQRLLTLVVR
jgi:preprotein translocase subunit SecE